MQMQVFIDKQNSFYYKNQNRKCFIKKITKKLEIKSASNKT